jgi:tRNA-splicing ligase RtcB
MVVRTYNDEVKYLERLTDTSWRIKKGFQPNMNVSGIQTAVYSPSPNQVV